MKRMKTLWLEATFLLLSIGLFGQDTKSDVLAYSFSYITPYLISSDFLECEYARIYINFEGNIHYKPFDRISFSSGLGFSTKTEEIQFCSCASEPSDIDYDHTVTESNYRIPIQVNYHISKSIDKSDWYLKAVYTNNIISHTNRSFANDELTKKTKSNSYEPSAGIGLGTIFLKDKPIGILVEGTIEKYLREYYFKNETWYSLKIGVVF